MTMLTPTITTLFPQRQPFIDTRYLLTFDAVFPARRNLSALAFMADPGRPGCALLVLDGQNVDVLEMLEQNEFTDIEALVGQHLTNALSDMVMDWRYGGADDATIHALCIANPFLAAPLWSLVYAAMATNA